MTRTECHIAMWGASIMAELSRQSGRDGWMVFYSLLAVVIALTLLWPRLTAIFGGFWSRVWGR